MSTGGSFPVDPGPMDVEDSDAAPTVQASSESSRQEGIDDNGDVTGVTDAVTMPAAVNGGPEMSTEVAQDAKGVTVPLPPNFDLEAYISRYTGFTRLNRLDWISNRCPELEPECLRTALTLLKQGINTSAYKELCKRAQAILGPEFALDNEWVEQVDRRYQQTADRLEVELSSYKTSLIKESIRMGYNELGDLFYRRGDLNSALKCYARTREYLTTNRHSAEMCLHIIEISVDMHNYVHVNNYVVKAEHTMDLDPLVVAKLKATSGLVCLMQGDYANAARKFLEVSPELGSSFSGVIVPEDVAVYGGLCALAGFQREEMKKKVVDNMAFKNFLDLVPQVRELIHDFAESRYKSCLSHLSNIRGELELDIHLCVHLKKLYKKIEDKCLMQYFSPYTSVKLSSMAEAIGMEVPELEKKVAALIISNQISARIDSKNVTLHAKYTDQRNISYHKVLEMGENYQRELRSMLLRMSCIEHDFIVRGRPGSLVGVGSVGAGGSVGGGGKASGSGGAGTGTGGGGGGVGMFYDAGGSGGGPMGLGMGGGMLEDDEHGGGGANAQQPSEGGGGSSNAGLFGDEMDTML